MKILKGYIRYFKYVLKHKRYVWVMCKSMGLYRQGIIHDWSKFLPVEAKRYMRYFSLDDRTVQYQFDRAWNHHLKYNKHHRQYRVLLSDGGTIKPLEMPIEYVKEMLCDWRSVGRCFCKKEELYKYEIAPWFEVYKWFYKNRDNMKLNPHTAGYIHYFLLSEYEKVPSMYTKE